MITRQFSATNKETIILALTTILIKYHKFPLSINSNSRGTLLVAASMSTMMSTALLVHAWLLRHLCTAAFLSMTITHKIAEEITILKMQICTQEEAI